MFRFVVNLPTRFALYGHLVRVFLEYMSVVLSFSHRVHEDQWGIRVTLISRAEHETKR